VPDAVEAMRRYLTGSAGCQEPRYTWRSPETVARSPLSIVLPAATHAVCAESREADDVYRGTVVSDRSLTAFWMNWATLGTSVETGYRALVLGSVATREPPRGSGSRARRGVRARASMSSKATSSRSKLSAASAAFCPRSARAATRAARSASWARSGKGWSRSAIRVELGLEGAEVVEFLAGGVGGVLVAGAGA
jgi:hypothetical protein